MVVSNKVYVGLVRVVNHFLEFYGQGVECYCKWFESKVEIECMGVFGLTGLEINIHGFSSTSLHGLQ